MDCRGAEILEEAGVEVIEIGDLAGLVREVNAHVLGPLTAPGESWRRSRRSQSLTTVSFQQPTVETTIRMDQGQNRALSGSVASVRLFSLEARAHARGGDRRNFERAMGLATEAFDRLPEQSTDSIFSFSALYFPYYAGSCYLWLHQPRRALEQAATRR